MHDATVQQLQTTLKTSRPAPLHSARKALASLISAFFVAGLGLPAAAASFASEYELLRQLPTAALSGVITNTGVPDAQGFIGFHQQQGKWIEAGAQRGGCWMLIGAVVTGDEKRADEAWRSIDATFAHQVEDGGFLSVRRPKISHKPTRAERVETAYFYLQELGHAILVVQASPMEGHFHDRIEALKPQMLRACAFIQSGRDGIVKKVGHTANRLLIAAKAFGLCGVVLNDEELKAISRKLVALALARRDADGVFIEKRGRDSSYNAVSLLMGQVLAIYQPDPMLDAAFVKAMAWERTRIKPTGEVEVKGNTRTGVGKEVYMGKPKHVNYREVILAFCYFGMIHDNADDLALAEKVCAWAARGRR
jgi:hypothetical protein